MDSGTDSLKLAALDVEDLQVLSAHLQDAVLRIADIAYVPQQRRFAAVVNRFDWASASVSGANARYRRRRAALRIDRVEKAQLQGIRLDAKDAVLELLAVSFEPGDDPSGAVHLYFAGGGAIRLLVECIEVELSDLGPVWETASKPEHRNDEHTHGS
ncbi:MAG: DUF2948 family protein [Pseudomonadota bacterium]|nr:DUF2948 family protein [Pseudomonadota bacterium]